MGNEYNPNLHHRRSIRKKGYDYREAGAYFVTVCTQGRVCLFGDVLDGELRLNDAGRMIGATLEQVPQRFASIEVDTFVVMPNHVHAIFVLTDKQAGSAGADAPLGDILGAFKSISTNEYIRGVKDGNWQPFPGKLWQRNFYERIIRDEPEQNAFREYISNNPLLWPDDENHP